MKTADKILFKDKLVQAKKFERQRRQIVEAEKALKAELAQEKREYIYNLALDFAHDMKDALIKNDYIHGRYSKNFTKYVNRRGLYLTDEHMKAQKEYMKALKNLNMIFAEIAEKDPEGFAEAVANQTSLNIFELLKL